MQKPGAERRRSLSDAPGIIRYSTSKPCKGGINYFAPTGLSKFYGLLSRGVAPGYLMPPLRGFSNGSARSWVSADEHQSRLFIESEHKVHVLHGLARRALHQVVNRREDRDLTTTRGKSKVAGVRRLYPAD